MLDSLDTLIAFVLIMLVVSLLITIAVQMVASVLNLRGLNLLKGLARTFTTIAPDLEAQSKDLANSILKGRLVSDSFLPNWPILRWWRHTTAIRPDEVFDSIHRIAIGQKNATEEMRQNAQNLLIALGVDKDELSDVVAETGDAQKKAKELADTADQVLESIPDQAARDKIRKALKDVTDRLSASEAALGEHIVAAASSIDAAYQKFQYWMCICEERVQQWFSMHTRIITVVFAFVFAFWLQLDAVDLFKLVSSNRAVREKLVAQSAAVTAQADKIFRDNKSVLEKAFDAWPDKNDPDVKAALAAASPPIAAEPNDTREKFIARIDKALASAPNKEAHLESLRKTIDNVALDTLKEKAGDYAAVKTDFENTGFDLFPINKRGRWGDTWCDNWKGHLWGVLFSVGLLSLGAPFWYNTLKNLSSLRSAVAQNMSKEQEQTQKEGDSAKPKPPPTVT